MQQPITATNVVRSAVTISRITAITHLTENIQAYQNCIRNKDQKIVEANGGS